MLNKLWNDEAGVIISAELVFVMTILVIGMVCGLAEIQCATVAELDDIAGAIGSLNQTYGFTGCSSKKTVGSQQIVKSNSAGSVYSDSRDRCDNESCEPSDLGCDDATAEKTN